MEQQKDQIDISRIRLKANASFAIREGWLAKGLRLVSQDPDLFKKEDAIAKLGVGSAMVKSIRHWMVTSGLTTESRKDGQQLTDMGKLVRKYDPYFEDPFTLCLVHYRIAANAELATAWYLLFNSYQTTEFTRDGMTADLCTLFYNLTESSGKYFAESSFRADCFTALRTYVSGTSEVEPLSSPEDNLQCPLAELGLFTKLSRNRYLVSTPPETLLHRKAVAYVILDRFGNRKEISFSDILGEKCNAGRIFHLNAYRLVKYLDELQGDGTLRFERTAGVNMIYPRTKLPIQVARNYYEGR